MEKKFPTFEFIIDDSAESGVKAISIVADPAFQSQFVTFAKSKPIYVALEKKKRICAGLSLIPNVPVFREDEVFGKYYGFFSAETIEKIVEKYHMEMNQNKVNLDHNENLFIDAFMVESYIVNSDSRVADLKELGIEHPNIMGAWYTAFKIKDEKAFDAILQNQEEGNGTGFSVEAFLDKIIVSMMKTENEKLEIKMKKEKKTLLEKIVNLFTEDEPQKFERMLVPELGFEIEWNEVGAPVTQVTVDEEGNEIMSPLGTGEYVTDSGVIVVDEGSNLVEVREIEVPVEDAPVEEAPVDMVDGPEIALPDDVVPVVEPIEEPVVEDVKVKTIGEIVGDQDGEYYIKVVVAGGVVSEAEVSSETNLLKDKVTEMSGQVVELTAQKEELEEKLKDPIVEPTLVPEVKTKDFKDMNAYEKTMHRRNLEK